MAFEPVARRAFRIEFENEYLREEMENGVREVHRFAVTGDGEQTFLLKVFGLGSGAAAVIGLTSYFLKQYFGEFIRPVAPNCVIFEVPVPKNNEKNFEKMISDGALMKRLQEDFRNIENHVRDILQEKFDQVDRRAIEHLIKTKITSLEICNDEELRSAWKRFWKFEENTNGPTVSQRVKITPEKISEIFDGNISESKIEKILDKFNELGVHLQANLAKLIESDISREFKGTLNLVELRELMAFVKGYPTPLAPINLSLSASGYPNTTLTVFFDDPNTMACKYLITAQDMHSREKLEVPSESSYGIVPNLTPGRQYVVLAQCVSNGIKSKECIFREPVTVCGNEDDLFARDKEVEHSAKNATKDPQDDDSGLPSTASDIDSAIDNMSSITGQFTKSARSVAGGSSVKKSTIKKADIQVQKERSRLWDDSMHRQLQPIFSDMDESSMNSLLNKCDSIGIKHVSDFGYLKESTIVEELKGTLKIVEMEKLLEFVKKRSPRIKSRTGYTASSDPFYGGLTSRGIADNQAQIRNMPIYVTRGKTYIGDSPLYLESMNVVQGGSQSLKK